MPVKRKAVYTVPIYIQPFTTTNYSEMLVGNCHFFLPPNAPVGMFPLEFRENLGRLAYINIMHSMTDTR